MMFEDALDYMKAATIRAAVNKSLEQGCYWRLSCQGATLIKQVILELVANL
jgi:hypothetical protein